MNIDICSRGVLLGVLSAEPGRWDLLLISNPGVEPPEGLLSLARRTLHLQFDDFDSPRTGALLPTREDVQRALEWSAGSEDLVVSCHAGRSRSAALAYVIRCRDYPPLEALEILTPGWHSPNALIVRLGAELLEDPSVHEVCAGWLGGQRSPERKRRRR